MIVTIYQYDNVEVIGICEWDDISLLVQVRKDREMFLADKFDLIAIGETNI